MTVSLNAPALARRILALQDDDGRIRWIDDGIWDPWNHAEAAMGLAVAGEIAAARKALDYLIASQGADGSWIADMGCAAPLDADNRRLVAAQAPSIIDTNFCAYPAVFAWHLALITAERRDLARAWPMVEAAFAFLRPLQRHGVFPWRAPEDGESPSRIDALLSGNASIALSLACAIAIGQALAAPVDHLRAMHADLMTAHGERRKRFIPKPAHAMDWYYPVLTGVIPAAASAIRLQARWAEFVDDIWGCRCVNDEPWATAAETAELAIACVRAGMTAQADALLAALARHDDGTGALWMGRQFAMDTPWPEDRPSWTAGAALMAVDAVEKRTPAAGVLTAPIAHAMAAARSERAENL